MATLRSLTAPVSRPPSIRRSVLLLALPAVGEQVLNTFVGLADTFFVGHLSAQASVQLGYSSASALAGVGLAGYMVWLINVFFMAVAIGSTALIARAKGAGDGESINRVLRQSLIIGLAMGALATLFALTCGPFYMRVLGAAPDVLPRGVEFISTAGLTLIPAALLFIGTAALRGVGDTRTPLVVMLGVNIVNIVVAWLLVNGNFGLPAMGVVGSAIGAAVARGGGGLVLIALLFAGRSGLKLSLDLRPDREMLRRIIRVGLPSGGEQLVFQGAMLIFVGFVTSLGTVAFAAHNVVINIESLSFLPGLGYAVAASALVGQRLGAHDPGGATRYADESLRQGLVMMSALGLVMFLFPHWCLSLFVADPAVVETGVGAMRIAGAFQPLLGINFILSGALRGAGDTRTPLYIKLVCTWGARLPVLMLIGGLDWGLTGIWVGMLVDYILQALFTWLRFRQGGWKTMRV